MQLVHSSLFIVHRNKFVLLSLIFILYSLFFTALAGVLLILLPVPTFAQTPGKADYQCVYSEGPNQCFTGVCDNPTKCAFNVGCKYQPGLTTSIDCQHARDKDQPQQTTTTNQQTPSQSSASNLVACKDNPVDPPKAPPSSNFKYLWQANCSAGYECKSDSDCQKNESNPAVNPENSNWCYKFSDGSKCLKLVTKRTALSVTAKRIKNLENYLKGLDKFSKIKNSTNSAVLKYNASITKTQDMIEESLENGQDCLDEKDQKKRDRCKAELKKNHNLAKAAYRLVKYYSILTGRSQTCVEADMGMRPRITGTSMDQHAEVRRVFFCSGKDNKVDKLNIKFRVKSKDGKKLVRVKENLSLDPTKLPNADQVSRAERLVGF